MARISEWMIEVYGSEKVAMEAIDFFQRGPGLRLRAYLRDHEAKLADLRHGMEKRKALSLQDRAIVLHARELSLMNLATILALLDQREITDEEAGNEGANIASESE